MIFDIDKLIELDTEDHRLILLRSYSTKQDIIKLFELRDAPPRDFTVKALDRFIHEPLFNEDEINTWDDNLLIKIAKEWAKGKDGARWELSDDVEAFSAFQQLYIAEIEDSYRRMQESISRSMNSMLNSLNQTALQIQQTIQPFVNSMTKVAESYRNIIHSTSSITHLLENMKITFNVGGFFNSLPDITRITNQYVALVEMANMIEEGGYSFMLSHWTSSNFVSNFKGINKIDSKVRNAVITNKMLAVTRNDDFTANLRQLIQSSSVLKSRWRIIEQALIAHQDGNYILSIPTFLAQAEGIFTDALVLKGSVVKVKGKIYVKDPQTGNPKLTTKGSQIELHSLKRKVQSSDLQNEKIVRVLGEFYITHIVDERNSILHGSNTKYDKAKLSVQLLLNIYLLAIEFAIFENENS